MFAESVIPLDSWVSQFVDMLVDNYRGVFQAMKWPVEYLLNGLDTGLNSLHPLIVITLIALAAWKFSGIKLGLFAVAAMVLTGLLGLWEDSMTTLAMVLASVIICTLLGTPLGIIAGRSDRFEAGLRPVLERHADDAGLCLSCAHRDAFFRGERGWCSGDDHFCTPSHHSFDQSGNSAGSSRVGGSRSGVWRDRLAGFA